MMPSNVINKGHVLLLRYGRLRGEKAKSVEHNKEQ
jgi:hypothetical protein